MDYTLFQDFALKITRPAQPPAAQPAPSQAVHRNLAMGPKKHHNGSFSGGVAGNWHLIENCVYGPISNAYKPLVAQCMIVHGQWKV